MKSLYAFLYCAYLAHMSCLGAYTLPDQILKRDLAAWRQLYFLMVLSFSRAFFFKMMAHKCWALSWFMTMALVWIFIFSKLLPLAFVALGIVSIALAYCDGRYLLLPDSLVFLLGCNGLWFYCVSQGYEALISALWQLGVLAIVLCGLWRLINCMSQKQIIACGDLKLMLAIGAALPAMFWPAVLFFASLQGLLYGYGMKLWVQVDLETFKIPFGVMLLSSMLGLVCVRIGFNIPVWM